jgi:hypothetical protein
MAQRGNQTLADYVVSAISPLLIMALVGSLVFFLVEVLYVGKYQGTLLYTFFFFVFGAVLVSRMSISEDGSSRASFYGGILGLVTWVALQRYVEFPPGAFAAEWGWAINLGLIVLIWWSAHRLTLDCTMMDDEEDASGVGLLQAAGLDTAKGPEKPVEPDGAEGKKPKRRGQKESPLLAWWGRYQRYREAQRRRPRTPGIWVVYFSLAALPLYGLGQSLIPPEEGDRRRHAFWLMAVYVASGLGLLLTTCFLGLRRYLRQRKLQMPAAMTGVWLLTGATLIAVFLVLGALLPRPSPEIALVDLPWLAGSKDRDASRWAMRGGEPGKGAGKGGAEGKEDEEANGSGGRGKQQGKDARDKGAAKASPGQNSSGSENGNQGGGTNQGKKAASGGKKRQASQGKANRPQSKNAGKGAKDNRAGPSPPEQTRGEQPAPSAAVPAWVSKIAVLLKWVVLGIFILVMALLVLRALLRFLAHFTGWAQRLLDALRAFWQGLWRGRKSGQDEDSEAEGTVAPRPAPFSSFRDPFLTGRAARMPVTELVRYSFEALEAWAWERDLPRRTGDTPLEFAERLAQEVPALEADVRRLTGYYAGLAYARLALTDDCRQSLREFWLLLAEVHERPLSAGASL